jgi:hypothetical protein
VQISGTDYAKNELLHIIKEYSNVLHTLKRSKTGWIGNVSFKKCLLKQVIRGDLEGTGRRGRGRIQLLGGLREATRYWNLQEEALDLTELGN